MTKVQLKYQRSEFHFNRVHIIVPLVRAWRRGVVRRLAAMAGA